MDSPTWTQALEQAAHRIAIGATDVYLSGTVDSLDWSKCVSMDRGGSHRLDIATSLIFEFRDKGITGRWHFDIEPREANGSGHYHVDVERCRRVLAVLPKGLREQFQAYLADCAKAVDKQADEYQQIATKEYGMAAALRAAASP